MGSRTLGGTQDGGQPKRKFKVFSPVTIKMINESSVGPNDAVEIDGESISEVSPRDLYFSKFAIFQIMIVGRIISRTDVQMRTVIGFDDSTGCIDVTFYQKNDSSVPQVLQDFEFKDGEVQFAKVTGHIRVFKDQKSVIGINL